MIPQKLVAVLPISDDTWDDLEPLRRQLAWDALKLEDWARGYVSPYSEPFFFRIAPWWTVPLAYVAIAIGVLEEASL